MKELLEKYPKAAKIVKEYYLNKLLESMKDKGLPDDFKEHVKQQGLPEEQIVSLIEINPGALIEVFDENNIFIDIDVHVFVDDKDCNYFSYKIVGTEIEHDSFETRKNAEKSAVSEAFEFLNKIS